MTPGQKLRLREPEGLLTVSCVEIRALIVKGQSMEWAQDASWEVASAGSTATGQLGVSPVVTATPRRSSCGSTPVGAGELWGGPVMPRVRARSMRRWVLSTFSTRRILPPLPICKVSGFG